MPGAYKVANIFMSLFVQIHSCLIIIHVGSSIFMEKLFFLANPESVRPSQINKLPVLFC